MAKGKYEYWLTEGGQALLLNWARNGLTDKEIAKNIHISRSTLNEWKKKYPGIAKALTDGKEAADSIVENALFKKAVGHTFTVKKAFKLKEVTYKDGKRVKESERIEHAEEEVFVPPDTMAQIYWLNNRKPKEWRYKPKEEIESSGIQIVFDDPESEEWAK
ncbi:MAG: helix-turn-helix domain-containing protein [Ruminococcus sp.]|nr:helix-turn-helix domain-containing protein [Ruminococcus sp.]